MMSVGISSAIAKPATNIARTLCSLECWIDASVPILKFLINFCVDRECAAAEAFYGGQDIVGCLGPAEGFGVGVASLDIGIDRRFQVRGRAMGATLDLSLGQQRKEPLDLVDP